MINNFILPTEDLVYIKNSLSKEINNLKKKHIMITGATGLFGRWFLIFFSYLNYKYNYQIQIFVIIRKTKKNLNFLKKIEKLFNINIVILTIKNYKFYRFKKKIDYFFHFASFSKDTKNWYEEHFHFSIIELKNLLNFFSKKINYFIFSSSGAANYLFTNNPKKDFYAECKRMSEQILKVYSLKFKFKLRIARCYSFYGKFLDKKLYAIANFLDAIEKKKTITLNSNGNSLRSYLHMSDLVIWFIKLIFLGKQDYIYNFGSDQKIKIKDMAKKIVILSKKKIAVKINKNNKSKFDYVPCIKVTKKDLQIKKFLSLEKILKNFFKYN